MNEPLRADVRTRLKPDAWYQSQWNVFWTIVGALLTAALIDAITTALVAAAIAHGFTIQFAKEVESANRRAHAQALEAQAHANAEAERHRPITVAPRSVEECLAETGGIANEQFARCRRGYTYTP